MARKEFRMVAIVVLSILLISNIRPIKSIYGLLIDENHYKYSNANGSYTSMDNQFKNSYLNLDEISLLKENIYLNLHSNDTVIYRCFKKDPFAFWRWGEYFYDKRYVLPYKSWKEIRKKRGYDLKYSTNFQEF
jgi:hypothetical protein